MGDHGDGELMDRSEGRDLGTPCCLDSRNSVDVPTEALEDPESHLGDALCVDVSSNRVGASKDTTDASWGCPHEQRYDRELLLAHLELRQAWKSGHQCSKRLCVLLWLLGRFPGSDPFNVGLYSCKRVPLSLASCPDQGSGAGRPRLCSERAILDVCLGTL